MAFTEAIIALGTWLGIQIASWAYLFYVPFTQISVIWIIVPIYLNWLVSEIWQEKKFTAFGNAISNGVIVLWVGIDWGRQLTNVMQSQAAIDYQFGIKLSITVLMLLYGLAIIIYGIKARNFIHYAGRVRVVTYLMIMFMPIMYGLVPADLATFLRIFIFLPLFYFIVEFIDWIVPDPPALDQDQSRTTFSDTLTPYPRAALLQNELDSLNTQMPKANNLPPMNATLPPMNQPINQYPQMPPMPQNSMQNRDQRQYR